jgi:hypothetical protein
VRLGNIGKVEILDGRAINARPRDWCQGGPPEIAPARTIRSESRLARAQVVRKHSITGT